VYRDGETRAFHDLDDSLADGFAASTAHAIGWLRGEADPIMDGTTARRVLRTLIAALDSSALGAPVDIPVDVAV
jgi:hypothetical protein